MCIRDRCDSVIIATGGLSYPLTGSTGDGYKFAKSLGHSIVDTKPSLIEMCIRDRINGIGNLL